MKKILFPFETNVGNSSAYSFATRLSRRTKNDLILLNAYQINLPDDFIFTKKHYNEIVRRKWLKAFDEVAIMQNEYLENFARVENSLKLKLDYRFILGSMQNELLDIISKEEISTVIFSIPVDDEKRNKLQATVNKVLCEFRIPVFITSEESKPENINDIVFATNFNALKNINGVFEKAIKLAEVFKANLHFIHLTLSSVPEDIKDSDITQRIQRLLSVNSGYKFKSIYGNDVIAILDYYIEQNSVDLLFKVGRVHNFFTRMMNISDTKQQYLNSKIPVWLEPDY